MDGGKGRSIAACRQGGKDRTIYYVVYRGQALRMYCQVKGRGELQSKGGQRLYQRLAKGDLASQRQTMEGARGSCACGLDTLTLDRE